jgi:fructose-1,6-bisphosphatase II
VHLAVREGLPGSLTTIAFAESGSMASLGVAFYMDKLVGPPAMRGVLDLTVAPQINLEPAAALHKPVEQLRVVVLDKPRHERLIERPHRAGASVSSPPHGDVAGALAALLPDADADLLMGTGGTAEGVMTACAVRALGGFMQARLAPERPDEAQAIASAGLSTKRVYELDELAAGESHGRALQATPFRIWAGEESNARAAQAAFAHRARCNGEARFGRYSAELEHQVAGA